MNSQYDLKFLEAMWVLGFIPPEDLPGIAANGLAQGIDSKSLRELACLSPEEFQAASRLFKLALAELGQGTMGKRDALMQFAKNVSASILTTRMQPLDGAKLIWQAALDANLPGFHELDGFIYAASELEDRPEDRELFERAICEEARQLCKAC